MVRLVPRVTLDQPVLVPPVLRVLADLLVSLVRPVQPDRSAHKVRRVFRVTLVQRVRDSPEAPDRKVLPVQRVTVEQVPPVLRVPPVSLVWARVARRVLRDLLVTPAQLVAVSQV